MNNILVTVVVPIYNVEKYLDECIISIVNQTYKNLEIILVDDGSPDNCPQKCDDWAQKDSRIKVIHKKNEGLGMARNTGIDNANGAYIFFFDSDDYIDVNLVDDCIKRVQLDCSDSVVYGTIIVNEKNEIIRTVIPDGKKKVYEGKEQVDSFIKHVLCGYKYRGKKLNLRSNAYGRMYSMNIIREKNFKFVSEREIISEDTYSLLEYYSYVHKISIIPKAYYYYRKNSNSLTNVYKDDRFERNNFLYIKLLELCEKLNYDNEIKRLVAHQYFNNVFSCIKLLIIYKVNAKEKIKDIINNHIFQDSIKQIKIFEKKIKIGILVILFRIKLITLSYYLIKLNIKKDIS